MYSVYLYVHILPVDRILLKKGCQLLAGWFLRQVYSSRKIKNISQVRTIRLIKLDIFNRGLKKRLLSLEINEINEIDTLLVA
jgi:hypothetical protein